MPSLGADTSVTSDPLQSRRAQHRNQVIVRRCVRRHDDPLALQIGETVDARRTLGHDAVVAVDHREEEAHVRVVAEDTQHLRCRIAGGMSTFQRDGSHATIDDPEPGTRRPLIGDVDRRRFDDRHRDGDGEHCVGRERRNRPLAGWNRRLPALREQRDRSHDHEGQKETDHDRYPHSASRASECAVRIVVESLNRS